MGTPDDFDRLEAKFLVLSDPTLHAILADRWRVASDLFKGGDESSRRFCGLAIEAAFIVGLSTLDRGDAIALDAWLKVLTAGPYWSLSGIASAPQCAMGVVTNLPKASALACAEFRVQAVRAVRASLSQRARSMEPPLPEQPAAVTTEGEGPIVVGGATPIAAAESQHSNRQLVDKFLENERRSGRKTTKGAVWSQWYTDSTEFERWQRGCTRTTHTARQRFDRFFAEKLREG